LKYDTNEQNSSRPEFLHEAYVYFKKYISPPQAANLSYDLLLEGNGIKIGVEVKEVADLWASLPPKGRLGRQCMDIAVTCDYGYLAILGSLDDVREAIPAIYMTPEGPIEKTEDQLSKSEDLLMAILGDIRSLGVTPIFLSRDPIFSYRTLLKYCIHDIIDDPPMSLLCRPYKNMHAINLLSNLPGIGWERAEKLIDHFGSVFEFMAVAQSCVQSGDFTTLSEIKINNRKLGKSAEKIFDVDGIWSKEP
jgi:hypothetical protein